MKTVAIIPARGGSKGIPRKNLLPFNGKPLISWNIEAALQAKLVDAVVVSTDDREIAKVSVAAGAVVVMRPDDISTDIASSEDALIHTLKNLGAQPDLTVFLQCTSPLTQSDDIDHCIQKLIDSNADSAFTATESHRFLWKNCDAATGVNHSGTERKRRQDLEPEYAENGAVYVMRTKEFMRARHRFFGKTVISEMPASRTWEIDTPEDIVVAESLSKLWKKRHALPETIEAVVFDFDGVMTDNAVFISEDGKESVRCNRSDGWGIARLHDAGIRMAVMSTEENPVVLARCRKLKLECFHQLGNSKIERFNQWCNEHNLNKAAVVYVGNDANDIECLTESGAGIVPADAHASAKRVADMELTATGGHGAVRELCDMILERIQNT
ncbi:acylneuraminate cytidylyltransferase [Pontiellaceae bacterium B1224]|nr:acylneuraminate cytidylyltransferase [Pontiellaceae bacterium B1224]